MTFDQARACLLAAQRIGIVRTDHLGDMVLTLPLARVLKEEFPAAELVMIAHSRTAPLLEGLKVIDRCEYVDRTPLPMIFRRMKFDVLFFPRSRPEEAWHAWRAKVPVRVGTVYRWWSGLYSVRIAEHRRHGLFHEAEYNVRMVEHIMRKRYFVRLEPPPVSEIARNYISHVLQANGIQPAEPFIVLHPGGRGSSPLWTKFPSLAKMLRQQLPNTHLVVTGITEDAMRAEEIVRAVPQVINLCGMLTLEQLIALLEKAAVVVANSTGIIHIAAALGRPVVGLYPASPPALSPARWAPLTQRRAVLAATPIDRISPIHVAEEVRKLLCGNYYPRSV
ncbi:MAG: glycosyltransferase family 9 protein [Candidatus Kapabacteria bacterium]|nr:glycosyltransferase family 9 protein [Candidatus Kapabacteria bacterium]